MSVPNLSLKSRTPLDGYREDFGGTTLEEATGVGLVSIATPRGGRDALHTAIQTAYGCDLPNAGSSTLGADGAMRLLGMQQDQAFALFDYTGDAAVSEVSKAVGEAAYYADQSDSWAMLRLSGEAAIDALERICRLDLDERVLPVGSVARTVMEHMGVVLFREGTDAFLLMGARSSAKNLLHAVEQSVRNVT